MAFDVNKIRQDFPILNTKVHSQNLIYLDNGASTQKPHSVIDRVVKYYQNEHSNVHRGVHFLSQQATRLQENARKTIANFINAKSEREIIFTKGTTEGINLIANSLSEKYLKKGDEIIITSLEHHANIVPWQIACKKHNAILKITPINENGEVELSEIENLISEKTKIIAFPHISNALGTILPAKEIIKLAKKHNIFTVVDGAQAIAHTKIDISDLNPDFYVFSGHKIYAPMGIGILYGRESILEEIPPYQTGGEMIDKVTFQETTYNELPFKFEAGTPNVEGILGLEAAINYVQSIGLDNIAKHEMDLLKYATNQLNNIEGLEIIGKAKNKSSLISFNLKNIHFFDVGTIIDQFGIALRTGNHCAQPLMDLLGIGGTVRPAFSIYNTKEEIDLLIEAILKTKEMLS